MTKKEWPSLASFDFGHFINRLNEKKINKIKDEGLENLLQRF